MKQSLDDVGALVDIENLGQVEVTVRGTVVMDWPWLEF